MRRTAKNAALERELVGNDDPEVYRVYADWLIEHGDPHGELIAIDLARELEPGKVALATARDVLLAKHREDWLGALPAHPGIDYRWRRGYIDDVVIVCGADHEPSFAPAWRLLRSLPIAKLLRTVELRGAITFDELRPMLDAPPLQLTTLRVRARHAGNVDSRLADDFVSVLDGSALLAQLRTLDFSQGHLTNLGVDRIAARAEAFEHLERIDLGETFVDRRAIERLRTRLANVVAR